MNREAKKYLRELRLCVPLRGKHERDFLSNVQKNIEDFLTDDPNAAYPAICKRFGEPKEIAGDYFENINSDDLIRRLRLSVTIRRAVLGVILLIALVCAVELGLYYRAYLNVQNNIGGYYEETIE